MRPSAQVLAGLLLAAVFAAPVSAATPGGAAEESVTGVLEMAQVDGFHAGPDRIEWTVRSDNRVTPVEFRSGNPRSLVGARVTLTGTRSKGVLDVASGRPGRTLKVREKTRATGMTNWAAETSDGTTQGGMAASAAAPTAVGQEHRRRDVQLHRPQDPAVHEDAGPGRAAQQLDRAQALLRGGVEGPHDGHRAPSFGWYTINVATHRLRLDGPGTPWPGTRPTPPAPTSTSYTNVMFLLPNTSDCAFAGLGYVPGQVHLPQRDDQRPGHDPRARATTSASATRTPPTARSAARA